MTSDDGCICADGEDDACTCAGVECSACGERHFRNVEYAWRLPSDGGAERDLVVRAPNSNRYVNVGILHVYDKWLTADEAEEMAAALVAAANAVRRQPQPAATTPVLVYTTTSVSGIVTPGRRSSPE